MTTATAALERATPAGHHEIRVLDHTGDTKTTWNPAVEVEVDIARATFDKFKKKGYLIYRTDKHGEKAEQMREFDETAARMICTPPVVGG